MAQPLELKVPQIHSTCLNIPYTTNIPVNRPYLGGTVPLLLPLSHRPTFTHFCPTFLNPLQLNDSEKSATVYGISNLFMNYITNLYAQKTMHKRPQGATYAYCHIICNCHIYAMVISKQQNPTAASRSLIILPN